MISLLSPLFCRFLLACRKASTGLLEPPDVTSGVPSRWFSGFHGVVEGGSERCVLKLSPRPQTERIFAATEMWLAGVV